MSSFSDQAASIGEMVPMARLIYRSRDDFSPSYLCEILGSSSVHSKSRIAEKKRSSVLLIKTRGLLQYKRRAFNVFKVLFSADEVSVIHSSFIFTANTFSRPSSDAFLSTSPFCT